MHSRAEAIQDQQAVSMNSGERWLKKLKQYEKLYLKRQAMKQVATSFSDNLVLQSALASTPYPDTGF